VDEAQQRTVPRREELAGVTSASTPDLKIALFRSLFRGREDVYPRRFESFRTGKAGYQPACANEWVRGICEKPKIRCSECLHQRWIPLTDQIIRWHLQGFDDRGQPFVAGVYPMLRDDTCWFLAADFDGAGWVDDAGAVLAASAAKGVPANLERSRSGEGGHVWWFFEEPVPAAMARRLGTLLLTEAMEVRPEIGLGSYDRMFPNQDTLPGGGFGNLIALPMQKAARERGNSVFVDAALQPHPDPWSHLAHVRRISRAFMETVVATADRRHRILPIVRVAMDDDPVMAEPWNRSTKAEDARAMTGGSLPTEVEVVLADRIYIPREAIPPALRIRLLRLAAFQNPQFFKAQGMRLPTRGIPRIISCGEDHPNHVALPRGCRPELDGLFRLLGIGVRYRDERFVGQPVDVRFVGELRPEQMKAAEALVPHDTGILEATTAFGKTVLGAWMIAHRRVNTLVLVHRQQLMDQWIERLACFLDVPRSRIGSLGAGRRRLGGEVDVALIQSLSRHEDSNSPIRDYGQVIVDECHHLSAPSYEAVVRIARARFFLGLSATLSRRDGHHPIVQMQCGVVRHRVDAKRQAEERGFRHHVFVRPTGFRSSGAPEPDRRMEFQNLGQALIEDQDRNNMVVADAVAEVRAGRSPLVLTERVEHVDVLEAALRAALPDAAIVVLRGGLGKRALAKVMASLKEIAADVPRILVATGKFIGEGFDDSRLDTLILTFPVSWKGTIAQYVGRLHRLHHGKKEVRVYDYADLDVPMLSRMFDRRCAGYEAVGYTLLMPASALPGWPAEVPLPVMPEWKRDYAASVRRLVLDGVDVSLARQFVHATQPPEPGAEGVARARSATEVFLFRRLETLPALAGRFRLNVRLAIPFDGLGEMEVDLTDAAARIAVELDGAQHLNDSEAYRRDRAKDVLLQEHGWMVLRFLAEDVGLRLGEVLDAILRAEEHQRQARPFRSGTFSEQSPKRNPDRTS
jgi:superfamily II DNA or RNA helicase/very-short-patch-repair endonuclease